jgi:hypothetical protein
MATIDLNRTQVGFAHENDTFGWYFYPRVQSPSTDCTNLGAIFHLLCCGGPTRDDELRTRRLEPGIRECEVLVVMPNFVPELKLDITTNWEKLTRPGQSKLGYNEMIDLGARVECVKRRAMNVCDQHRYRPGDYERLVSRVEQLEKMLPLQTYAITVPYQYDLPGSQLFDKGAASLEPDITGYYGLSYIKRGSPTVAQFFLTGHHFHPTRTRVIVGGTEVHSNAQVVQISTAPTTSATMPTTTGSGSGGGSVAAGTASGSSASGGSASGGSGSGGSGSGGSGGGASGSGSVQTASATQFAGQSTVSGGSTVQWTTQQVEVISRDLLRITVSSISPELSAGPIPVRVATPAGLSNEFEIAPAPPDNPPPSAFSLANPVITLPYAVNSTKTAVTVNAVTAASGFGLKWAAPAGATLNGVQVKLSVPVTNAATTIAYKFSDNTGADAIDSWLKDQCAAALNRTINFASPPAMPSPITVNVTVTAASSAAAAGTGSGTASQDVVLPTPLQLQPKLLNSASPTFVSGVPVPPQPAPPAPSIVSPQ